MSGTGPVLGIVLLGLAAAGVAYGAWPTRSEIDAANAANAGDAGAVPAAFHVRLGLTSHVPLLLETGSEVGSIAALWAVNTTVLTNGAASRNAKTA